MIASTRGSMIYIYSQHDQSTKYTALTRIMFSWMLFSGYIQRTASNSNSCFTWTNQGKSLRLVCRPSNFNKTVAILDPNGKQRAYCDMHTKGLHCSSRFAKEKAEFKKKLKQIVLTIPLALNRYEGKWTCNQGNWSYTTTVNMAKGIISSTNVRLNGQIHTKYGYLSTSVTCASCREPYGNIAGFQLNGRTVAQIRYDKTTKTCVQRKELCNGTTCACSLQGSVFFLRMVASNGSRYSCLMQFEDMERGIRFQQTTTLVLNGQEFHEGNTKTVILNEATTNIDQTTTAVLTIVTKHEELRNVFRGYLGVWTACLVLVFLAIIVFVLTKIGLHLKGKKKKFEYSKYSSKRNERKSMLSEKEQFNKHSEMINPGGNGNLTAVTVHDSETHTFESVPFLDIPVEVHLYQKRWLLFGISLLQVYKNFRTDIEQLFSTEFRVFKEKHKVNVQIYPEYVKTVQATSGEWWQLNYAVINGNKIRFGSDTEKYDYRIESPLALSKMVLPEIYTNYSAFDDSMSFNTILRFFGMFPLYHTNEDSFRTLAQKTFQSTWIRWCDPRPRDWDEQHSKNNISLLVEMSKHSSSSNPDQMTEQEINKISENGLTLLTEVAKFEDYEFLERIVGYITALVQFLEISYPEFETNRMSKIKSTISEWGSSLKGAMDALFTKMENPSHGKRIWNAKDFKKHVHPFTHVAVRRGKTNFPAVVSDTYDIIRLDDSNESNLLDFKSGLFFIDCKHYPKQVEEIKAAYTRRTQGHGECQYNVSSNNCETFVRWVLTGKRQCEQFERANEKSRFLVDGIDSVMDCEKKAVQHNLSEVTVQAYGPSLAHFKGVSVQDASTKGRSAIDPGVSTEVTFAPKEAVFCGLENLDLDTPMKNKRIDENQFKGQLTNEVSESATAAVAKAAADSLVE